MNCPRCNSDDIIVIDNRSNAKFNYRKRKCRYCLYVFYTEEKLSDKFKYDQIPPRWLNRKNNNQERKKKNEE